MSTEAARSSELAPPPASVPESAEASATEALSADRSTPTSQKQGDNAALLDTNMPQKSASPTPTADVMETQASQLRSRARSKPLPPPLELATALKESGRATSLSPVSPPDPVSPSGMVVGSQSLPAIPSSMSENEKIREKARQKVQLNSWKFPASPTSPGRLESEDEQKKNAEHASKSPVDTELVKQVPSTSPSPPAAPSIPVIAPPRESSMNNKAGHGMSGNAMGEGENIVPAAPTDAERSHPRSTTGRSSSSSRNFSVSSAKNSAAVSSVIPTPVSPRLMPLPPSPRAPRSIDSLSQLHASLTTSVVTSRDSMEKGDALDGSSLAASAKVAAWLDRTPVASPRTGSQPASGAATPVPTAQAGAPKLSDALAKFAPGARSASRTQESSTSQEARTAAAPHSPLTDATPISSTPPSLTLPSSSRHALASPVQKIASSPSKGSSVPTLSHTVSTSPSSAVEIPATPTSNAVDADLPSSLSDVDMRRASLSAESSMGESAPLATPSLPPAPFRSNPQKDLPPVQSPAIAESPIEGDFRLPVEESGVEQIPYVEQKASVNPSTMLDTLVEEEDAPDFVIPLQPATKAIQHLDSGLIEVTDGHRSERARKSKSTLFGRRRNKNNDLVTVFFPRLATLCLLFFCSLFYQPEISIMGKPQKSSSLTNLRRTVTSGFSSTRAKPTPKHSLPLPPKRELSPLRSDSSATTSGNSAAPSSPFLSPHAATFNGRMALSPTMHSRASIIVQANTIEDDESRRLSELAFLD